jgi:ferredoxin
MKVKVDQSKCISCGLCTTIAPDHFQFDPKTNKATVIKQPEQISEEIERAINGCPTEAIEKTE